jgi:hypothetical protein
LTGLDKIRFFVFALHDNTSFVQSEIFQKFFLDNILTIDTFGSAVSHITNFGDVPTFLYGDAASAVVYLVGNMCFSREMRDLHGEMWVHFQNSGYVTSLTLPVTTNTTKVIK